MKASISTICALPALLLVSAMLLASCDYVGRMYFVNETGGKARIRFFMYATRDSVFVDEVRLPDEKGSNTYLLDIGFNELWDDERIIQHVGNIQKIEIITPSGATVIAGREQLFKYIRKHIRRFSKSKVIITLKK